MSAEPRPGQSTMVVHQAPGDFPSIGPRHAPVTVEFFVDFGEGRHSSKAFQRLIELANRHPRRLRVVFYVGASRTQQAELNEAAYEAFAQGKFEAFARVAFAHGGRPSPRFLEAYAGKAELDYDAVQAALADHRHLERIRAANALRMRRGSTLDTRRLVFNGELVNRTLTTAAEFEEAYDEAYARARALLRAGVPLDRLYERLLRQRAARHQPIAFQVGAIDESPVGAPPPLDPPHLVHGLDLGSQPSLGAPDARVVVGLFCNLQSSKCAGQWPKIHRLVEVYPDDVRLILWPLVDADVHPRALRAHEAALCAGDQGQFWEFAEATFSQRRDTLEDAALLDRAAALELDTVAFDECLAGNRHAAEVRAAVVQARTAGVTHTPSLVIGGRLYVGFRADADLRAMIELELRPGLLERAEDLRFRILDHLAAPPPAEAP